MLINDFHNIADLASSLSHINQAPVFQSLAFGE
jgi:hypothetical protein